MSAKIQKCNEGPQLPYVKRAAIENLCREFEEMLIEIYNNPQYDPFSDESFISTLRGMYLHKTNDHQTLALREFKHNGKDGLFVDIWEQKIAALIEDKPEFDGIYTHTFREAKFALVETLIQFYFERSDLIHNSDQLGKFTVNIKNLFFTTSHTLCSGLSIKDQLYCFSQLSRIPEFTSIHDAFRSELAYSISFGEINPQALAHDISIETPGRQLDLIYQLPQIASKAVFWEYEYHTLQKVITLLKGLYEISKSEIVKLGIISALTECADLFELEGIKLNVDSILGHSLCEIQREKIEKNKLSRESLNDVVRVDGNIKNGTFEQIASDAIILKPTFGRRSIGICHLEQPIPALPVFSQLKLQEIIDLIDNHSLEDNEGLFFNKITPLFFAIIESNSKFFTGNKGSPLSKILHEVATHTGNMSVLINTSQDISKSISDYEDESLSKEEELIRVFNSHKSDLLQACPNPNKQDMALRYSLDFEEVDHELANSIDLYAYLRDERSSYISLEDIRAVVERIQHIGTLTDLPAFISLQNALNDFEEWNSTALEHINKKIQFASDRCHQVLESEVLKGLKKLAEDLKTEIDGKRLTIPASSFQMIEADSRIVPFLPENKEEISLLLYYMYDPIIRGAIEASFSFSFTDLNLREQIYLLSYLSKCNSDDFDKVNAATTKHPSIATEIVRSFLATAAGEQLGEIILELARSLETPTFHALLTKYLNISNSIDDIESFLFERFSSIDPSDSSIREIRQRIITRANRIIEAWHKNIPEANRIDTQETMLDKLERAQKEVYQLGEAIKVLSKSEEITLASINSIELDSVAAISLSHEERELFLQIAKERTLEVYGHEGYMLPFGEFEKSITDPSTTIHFLKVEGCLVAFLRSNSTDMKGQLYLGSLNADSNFEGYRFGFTLFNDVLTKLGTTHTLTGFVHENNRDLLEEYKKCGFVVIGSEIVDGEKTGYLKIKRPPKLLY